MIGGSMRWMRRAGVGIAVVLAGSLLGGVASAADSTSQWNSAGGLPG
jgi:hypothetical protein